MVKGEDEYMIVVSGVKDTGLYGGYWGNTENLGSRRRSKPVEALQIGSEKKRSGSVGSVGSSILVPKELFNIKALVKVVAGISWKVREVCRWRRKRVNEGFNQQTRN